MTSGEANPTTADANPLAVATGWLLVIAFVALCACLGDISGNVRVFQAGYLVGFVGFALLAHSVCRRRPPGHWGVWLAGCLVLRIAVLNTAPSDDLYRYLWEGRIQVEGHNPFAVAPDHPSLSELRDDNWAHINHREYPAIYPPLAQLQFYCVALVWPSLLGIKTLYVALDGLAVVLLAVWLRREGRPPHRAILYGLCPLVLTASAVQGHLDSAMIVALAAAGIADAYRKPYACATFLAAAVLTKIVPVVLVPWLARKNIRAAGLLVVLVVLGYLPYAGQGADLFHSLVKFPRDTEMLSLGHGAAMKILDGHASRVACALVVMSVALWHARKPMPLSRVLLPVFGTLIICLPVVHFWYVVWVVIALPFVPRVAWLVLCASMVFYFESTHVGAVTGTWSMPTWVPYPVYVPFVIALAVEHILGRRRSGTHEVAPKQPD